MAAWKGPGKGDVITSLDLRDIVVLFDGRGELVDELLNSDSALQDYVRNEVRVLLSDPNLDYLLASALHGHGTLADERASKVREVLKEVASRS